MNPAPPYPVSDHCDGFLFFNPDRRGLRNLREILRWKRTSRPAPWPRHVPLAPAAPRGPLPPAAVRATWINHATFLLESALGNILIDPVYSRYCGPLGLLGPPRVHAPGIPFAELPPIDYLLLSHDHYDHCDLPTLAKIARAHRPLALTPLGNRDLLLRAGLDRIIELDWWQHHAPAPGLRLTVTPAQHWSNRLTGPRCGRLWGGFHLQLGPHRLLFTGDSAYNPHHFRDIARRLGPPDLAMIPIGAYEPRWFMREQHCDPAEAVQIHLDLAARTSVAMHWGAFQLTDEARDEPPRALAAALASASLAPEVFKILEPGAHLLVSS